MKSSLASVQRTCDIRSHRRHSGGQGIGHQLCLSRRGFMVLLHDERPPSPGSQAPSSLWAFTESSHYCPEIDLYLGHLPYTLDGPLHNQMRAFGIETKNNPVGWHPGLGLNLLCFQKGNTKKIKKVQIWVTYILGKRGMEGRRSLI